MKKGDIKNIDTRKQSRQIFRWTFLKDKVVCFISDWEKSKIASSAPINKEEKLFVSEESALFEKAKNLWRENNIFSFFAFEKIKDIEYHAEGDLQKNINLLSTNSYHAEYINKMTQGVKAPGLHKINVLCIDYGYFDYFVINQFLRFMESKKSKENIVVLDKKMDPLFELFRCVSPDINLITYQWLRFFINKAHDNSLGINDWDKIENLSTSHLQNMTIPSFWTNIKDCGYLCEHNIGGLKFEETQKKDDFKIFYSLESLLFYELKNCLKKIKRCKNCGSVIGITSKKYRGQYCPPGSENYEKCSEDRNRKRQKRHYDLTKK